MEMQTAYRTVHLDQYNTVQIHAEYTGGPYIDLHWHTYYGPAFEVINVWDYRAGKVEEKLNISAKLTEWIKATGKAEIALRSMRVELDRAERVIKAAIYAHDPYLESPDQDMLKILQSYKDASE